MNDDATYLYDVVIISRDNTVVGNAEMIGYLQANAPFVPADGPPFAYCTPHAKPLTAPTDTK
jgi:hypothetical protein